MPRPEGSSVPRRCICAPASVHEPEYNQLPQEVVPSSFSHGNPGSCWAAFIGTPGCVSRVRSASAFPLISFATSASDGFSGVVYDQLRLRMGSGNFPTRDLVKTKNIIKKKEEQVL